MPSVQEKMFWRSFTSSRKVFPHRLFQMQSLLEFSGTRGLLQQRWELLLYSWLSAKFRKQMRNLWGLCGRRGNLLQHKSLPIYGKNIFIMFLGGNCFRENISSKVFYLWKMPATFSHGRKSDVYRQRSTLSKMCSNSYSRNYRVAHSTSQSYHQWC